MRFLPLLVSVLLASCQPTPPVRVAMEGLGAALDLWAGEHHLLDWSLDSVSNSAHIELAVPDSVTPEQAANLRREFLDWWNQRLPPFSGSIRLVKWERWSVPERHQSPDVDWWNTAFRDPPAFLSIEPSLTVGWHIDAEETVEQQQVHRNVHAQDRQKTPWTWTPVAPMVTNWSDSWDGVIATTALVGPARAQWSGDLDALARYNRWAGWQETLRLAHQPEFSEEIVNLGLSVTLPADLDSPRWTPRQERSLRSLSGDPRIRVRFQWYLFVTGDKTAVAEVRQSLVEELVRHPWQQWSLDDGPLYPGPGWRVVLSTREWNDETKANFKSLQNDLVHWAEPHGLAVKAEP